jgi:hypothetical protein
MSGYRDGNVYAPQEFGQDFGSANFPHMPNSSIYDTEGWYSYANPYTSGFRTIHIQNMSHPSNYSPSTNPSGILYRGTTPPLAPPANTAIYIGDHSYWQVVTPSGTTNIPLASMTEDTHPATPGAYHDYTLVVPTPSLPTYVLGNGQTGSLGLY